MGSPRTSLYGWEVSRLHPLLLHARGYGGLSSTPPSLVRYKTDASAKAVGAVLIQDGHPVAYESKMLNGAQKNYSAYERELFAIMNALRKWRHYLYGAQFEIVFDHESIKWFMNQTDLKMG